MWNIKEFSFIKKMMIVLNFVRRGIDEEWGIEGVILDRWW